MQKSLVWLLVLVVLLASCAGKGRPTAPGAAPVPAQAPPGGPTAEAVPEGTGIRFHLKGYKGPDMPRLKVTSADGTDWSARVGPPAREGEAVTAKLSGEKGTAKLAVENFEYAWTLPEGQEVKGAIQFRDFRFRDMAWQLTRTERFLIYHVNALGKRDVEAWEQALAQVLRWTGQTREKPLVIWVFPSTRALNDWARYGVDITIVGQWRGDIDRLLVCDQADAIEREVVMLHEMVHAVTPAGFGPAWYNEGAARLLEARYERALEGEGAARWRVALADMKALQALALQRSIDTAEALGHKDPPTDPYTLGVSVWLFIIHRRGEEGFKRFFQEGGKENGVKFTLESLFDKPLPEVWAEWNGYLRSPDLLADWHNP